MYIDLSFKSYGYKMMGIINIPTPSSISYMWNFGSLLGLCLVVQIFTGFFLSMHYTSSMDLSFSSVVSICMDVNWGWLMRMVHANGASMFFIFVYLHIGRGLYYNSYKFTMTWLVGVMILLMLMGISFLGYVLPWGQMSFWGATVITNLLSAVPYLGSDLVQWVWGGFSVNKPTLTRFFSIHFVLPFILLFLVLLHLMFLHSTGSNNPLGLDLSSMKIDFHPYFSVKDLLGFSIWMVVFTLLVSLNPFLFMDPDNFIEANPMVTPPHIQPEWYFLHAYAILRSIPNKLGGVMALLFSILILGFLPFMTKKMFVSCRHSFWKKISFWFQVSSFLLLIWLGSMPVETPFIEVGQAVSFAYFFLFILLSFL